MFARAAEVAAFDEERMKVRDAIRMIERDGWGLVNQEGSHRQFKHPVKKG